MKRITHFNGKIILWEYLVLHSRQADCYLVTWSCNSSFCSM